MRNESLNPITLSVLWNGLLSIAEEMGTTLQMTAFSEAVREGQDFSTAIFDRKGRLIAQGTHDELILTNDLYRRMCARLSVGRSLDEPESIHELLQALS